MRMCTQNVTTPTMILNFREENFRDQKSNHEIHENIVPRKFGAIRYDIGVRVRCTLYVYKYCNSVESAPFFSPLFRCLTMATSAAVCMLPMITPLDHT